MGFLVPALLAGLAALGIPLLLHLRQRDRQRPTPFPSLMFLRRIPIRTDRRRRITDLPLLLLRALAVALLVLAFARPYLRSALPGAAASAGLTVVLVDRSESMSHREVRAAVVESLAVLLADRPTGRRMAVIGYDQEAELLAAPTTDPTVLQEAMRAATPRAGGTQASVGWRIVTQVLSGEVVPGEVLWVTDRQRSALPDEALPALSAGTRTRVVEVAAKVADNSAVAALEWEPLVSSADREGVVAAQLVRHGGDTARTVTVTLSVDGRITDTARAVLPPDGTARVTFRAVALPRAAARLTARLEPDALAADDAFHAVIPADDGLRVALVTGASSEGRYLEGALGIGREPAVTVERVAAITADVLARSAVAWFHDVPPPSGGDAAALEAWVRAGGGVVVSVGPRLAAARDALDGSYPAAIRGEAARTNAMLGDAALAHPALAPFRGAGPDPLATVRTRRQPLLAAAAGATTVLAFEDGLPALAVASRDAGRVAVLAVPLELGGGDFPLQPAFLPFVRGLVNWAAGRAADPSALRPGEVWRLPRAQANAVVRSPAGTLSPVTDGLVVMPPERGVFEAFEGEPGGVPVSLMAVNAPTTEADLRPDAAADAVITGTTEAGPLAGEVVTPAPAELEARQGGWRWLLLLAVLVLGTEVVVASRGWRGVAPARTITEGEAG